MDPIQCALDLRQARLNRAIFRKNSVPDAFDDAMELAVRMSHQENVDSRSDVNVFDLRLPIVRDHIPNGGIDECEHRSAWTRIGAHGNVHVRHVSVEGCKHSATL